MQTGHEINTKLKSTSNTQSMIWKVIKALGILALVTVFYHEIKAIWGSAYLGMLTLFILAFFLYNMAHGLYNIRILTDVSMLIKLATCTITAVALSIIQGVLSASLAWVVAYSINTFLLS